MWVIFRNVSYLIGSILCDYLIESSIFQHLFEPSKVCSNFVVFLSSIEEKGSIYVYLTVCLYIMEIITSLLDVVCKIWRWCFGASTVISNENFPSRLQPFVECSEQCWLVLRVRPAVTNWRQNNKLC